MTIRHHPDADWLLAYASGRQAPAQALATASHLALCPVCRQQLAALNALGGTLLEQVTPVALRADSWQHMLARLQRAPTAAAAADVLPMAATMMATTSGQRDVAELPAPLRKLLPQGWPRHWRWRGSSLQQATLQHLPDGTVIALHRIRAGGKVPRHRHDGIEITVVLDGSFSDQFGLYQTGDMLVLDETVEHRPTAMQNEDCLCLTIQAAPVRLTGPIGRWFNPLIRAFR